MSWLFGSTKGKNCAHVSFSMQIPWPACPSLQSSVMAFTLRSIPTRYSFIQSSLTAGLLAATSPSPTSASSSEASEKPKVLLCSRVRAGITTGY